MSGALKPPASLARWIEPDQELLWWSTASARLLPRLPLTLSHLRWLLLGLALLTLGSTAGALWASSAERSPAMHVLVAVLAGATATPIGLVVAADTFGHRVWYALVVSNDGRRSALVAFGRRRAIRFRVERAPLVGPRDPADVDWGQVDAQVLPDGAGKRSRIRWHSIQDARRLIELCAAPERSA